MAFCSCGRQAVIKTSWSDGHPGRRFYGCIKQGPCCRWIGWVDPPMCPRSIQIIPGLLRARNRHEASIQELTNEVAKLKKYLKISWFVEFVWVKSTCVKQKKHIIGMAMLVLGSQKKVELKIVKSPTPIFNAVLGLPSKTTWATMVKKMGIRGAGNTGKGKEKV
ncbi:hypothetical protein Tco_0178109 [Tanacetum coccineum]